MAKSGRYFGLPLKGFRCVNQSDPLSPQNFNVSMDAVIRHWMMVVTPIDTGTVVLGLTIIDLAAYLYSNNGFMASTQM